MQVVLSERNIQASGPIELTSDLVQQLQNEKNPVNLDLEFVLAKMPRKVFQMTKYVAPLVPLSLPTNLQVADALHRVLRLPSVASKRYLTNKVDRSVTGLVAQQQCVGPLHTPLADVAVIALSYFGYVRFLYIIILRKNPKVFSHVQFIIQAGSATSIGEQPVKGLLCPSAGARMTICEALSNLVFAKISDIKVRYPLVYSFLASHLNNSEFNVTVKQVLDITIVRNL